VKARIICAVAALAAVCPLAGFAPAIFGHRDQSSTVELASRKSNAIVLRKLRFLRDEWVGCALTAQAAFRYLLEPEAPETTSVLVASNGAGRALSRPGGSLPSVTPPIQSNLPVSQDATVTKQFAHLSPSRNEIIAAPVASVVAETNSLPSQSELAATANAAASRSAAPIIAEEGSEGRGRSVRIECATPVEADETPSTEPTCLQSDSSAPVNHHQPVSTGAVEAPE